jgi:hypothetical protein
MNSYATHEHLSPLRFRIAGRVRQHMDALTQQHNENVLVWCFAVFAELSQVNVSVQRVRTLFTRATEEYQVECVYSAARIFDDF